MLLHGPAPQGLLLLDLPGSLGREPSAKGECVMRKMLVAGALSTIAIVGTAVPAAAQPPGQEGSPEVFDCGGEETLIVTAGRNGWIGGVKYQAATFSVEGTFTPVGGTPEPFSDSKTWAGGKDANSPDLITCTSDFTETDETGTAEGRIEITAVPAG